MGTTRTDREEIDALVASFFALFDNRGGRVPELDRIHDLAVPRAIVSRCVAVPPEISTLEEFVAPRRELLGNGTLTEFHEAEISERTLILGNVAQRVSTYEKSGRLRGVPFATRGVKTFQLVRGSDGWRISAVAWDDERDGFALDPAPLAGFDPGAWRASPILGVPHVRRAAEYYRDVLGFSLDPVDGIFQPTADEPGGVYAIVKRPGAWIHLQIRRGTFAPRTRQAFERDVYVYVNGVDALHEELVRRGAKITQAPRTAPYGLRELDVEDLDGYRLTFGEPAP